MTSGRHTYIAKAGGVLEHNGLTSCRLWISGEVAGGVTLNVGREGKDSDLCGPFLRLNAYM